MPFDYESNIAAVINALKGYNTTTSSPDLSSGLTTRLDNANILQGNLEIQGVQSVKLPAIYVRVIEAGEEPAGIGETGPTGAQKFKTARYEIVGLYRREGIGTPISSLMTEVYRLAENIEGVYQKELDLSNTALWCHTVETTFSTPLQHDTGAWVMGVRMNLEARYLFR